MWAKDFPTATEHEFNDMNQAGLWVCDICGHSVKIRRGGACPGVPVYSEWDDIPDGLATKTSLERDHSKKLADGQQPTAAKQRFKKRGRKWEKSGFYPLYEIDQADDKQEPTEQQLAALEKARHMAERIPVPCRDCGGVIWGQFDILKDTRKQIEVENKYAGYTCEHCDWLREKQNAARLARQWLNDDNAIILDTETTDIDGEIIEIAIIDTAGTKLLDQRIKPAGKIDPAAKRTHGISLDDLADEPEFSAVYPMIESVIRDKHIIIYNADFDISALRRQCRMHDIDFPEIESISCAMETYAVFYGEWSNYFESYKWQPLPGGDHSALGDCLATLKLVKKMASYES